MRCGREAVLRGSRTSTASRAFLRTMRWLPWTWMLLGVAMPAQREQAEEQEQRNAWQQTDDGCWRAIDARHPSPADVRVTAWMALVLVGDGSTLRSGPYRDSLKQARAWLLAQQDPQGRYGFASEPDWLLDHAMVLYAHSEMLRVSDYERPVQDLAALQRGCTVLHRTLARMRPAPSLETRLWCEMLQRSLRVLEAKHVPLGAQELADAVAELPPLTEATARDRTVQRLRDLLADPRPRPGQQPLPFPADPLADPLELFYFTAACWQLGGRQWKQTSNWLTNVLVKAEQRAEDGFPTWAGSGSFATEHGRIGVSATCLLTLQLYYRYSSLEIAR